MIADLFLVQETHHILRQKGQRNSSSVLRSTLATCSKTNSIRSHEKCFLLWWGLLLTAFPSLIAAQSPPANPQATSEARSVLSFLVALRGNNQILLGQSLGHGNSIVDGYQRYVVEFAQNQIGGAYIGLVGGDFGLDPNFNAGYASGVLMDHARAGGIITLSWHFDNPWTGGDSWNTNKQENLWELIDYVSCNSACQKWQGQKTAIARALRPFFDAGIPVLWRPLHEMNGDWFWWGQKTVEGHEDAFIALWKDMFDYLTSRAKLHNLLWVYSTANSWDPLLKNYYPGKNFVDVVGIDVYSDEVTTWFTDRDYNDLKSLGNHPMGLTEFGPTLDSANGQYDYRDLLDKMSTSWPDFVFSYSWHNWFEGDREVKVAYTSNPEGIAEVFSISQVITRDKIDMDTPSTSAPVPKTPAPVPNTPAPVPNTPAPVPDPPAPTSPPVPLQNGRNELRLRNRWQESYANLSNNSEGALVDLKPLNSNWWSMLWYLEESFDSDYPAHVRFRCKWGDFYLHNSEDVNNADIVGWPLNDGSLDWWSLRWELQEVEPNVYRVINAWTGRCLGAGQNPYGEYDQVDSYDCVSEWRSQQWVFEYIESFS